MPLWRRRSKRPDEAPAGPPQLPSVGAARQSMSLTTLAAMYAPGNERDDTASYAGTEDMQTRSVGQPTQHAAALRSFPHQPSSDDIESEAEVPEGVQKPDNLPEGTKLPAPGTWSRSAGRAPVAVTADVHYRPGSMRPTYSSPAINQSADSQQQQRPTHARANTAQGVAGAPRPVNYSRPTTPSAAKNPPPALGSEGNDAMPQPHPTSPPPQYHRPLAGASAVVTPQSSPAKAAPAPASTPSSVLARPSPRKRERGPPPSAFTTSGYNIASDFRISPAAHAAAQPQPSPQARRSAVESARAKALRKGRAPTRLNVMVVGEAGQGKTLFLRSLLQTLLGEVGDMSDIEEPLATVPGDARALLQSFGLNARGKQGRTRQISLVEGIELVPDQEVLLNGIVDEEAEQQQARPSLRRNASSTSIGGGGRRRRRGSNVSRTSAPMSLLGSAAPPNRLSLTLIDTPGVPSVLPQSLLSLHANASSTIPAPAFLRPVLDEITSRYARTLKEESKLRRVPSKTGAGGDSEHVHVVVWFASPTEILEGGRTWWREEQERQIWEKRERREKERQQAEREKVEALKAEQEKAMMREAQDNQLLRSPSKKGSKTAAGGRPDGAQHQRRRTTSNPARPSSSSSSSAANGNAARHQGGGEKASGEVERRGSGRKRANSLKGIFQDLKIGSTDAPLPPRREASGALSPRPDAMSTDDEANGFAATQGKEDDANGDTRDGEDQGDDDEDYYDESHYEPTLSPSQKLVLAHLLPLVPVLPIIARAETLTTQQLEAARRGVQRGWQEVVHGLEKSPGRQRKVDAIGSPATESWGWIGFGGAAGQATAAKKAGRRRQQQQQRRSDDEDEEEEDDGGTSGEDVKLIRIKSRRSYSSQAARNLGGSSTTGHGAEQEEEERLRESPVGRRQRESSDGGTSSSGSAIGHTSPLFARPPAYKKALNRSGSQSSSAVAHGGSGAAGQEESEVETEEHFDPADPDPRLLLGVQDVVPSKTQMEGRWPLAIWAPEPAQPSASASSKMKTAQLGAAGGRAQKLQEASNQLEGSAIVKERGEGGDTQGEERNGLQEGGGGEDVRFSMIPTGGNNNSNSAGAVPPATTTTTTTTAKPNPSHSTTHHQPLPLTRTYPWGSTLHLLNPSQSDFLALKAMLLGTHTGVILETSKEAFESWRGETLELQQLKLREKEKGVGGGAGGEGKQGQQRGADGQWVVL